MHPNFNWWIHCDYLKTVITMYSACPHWVFGFLPPVTGELMYASKYEVWSDDLLVYSCLDLAWPA